MSSFTKLTLGEVVPQIMELFESFGVKSIIIKKGNEWLNIASIIQFTRRKVDDLSNEYRFLEEKLGKIDEDNFKIILQARHIEDFSNVLKELQTGCLRIGEIASKLLIQNAQSIANQRIGQTYGGVQRAGEYAEYNSYGVTMGFEQNIFYAILSDFDNFTLSMGFKDRDELVRSWLGLDSYYQANTFFILIPIYASIGEIQYQGGSEIKLALKIDQHLLDNSYMWLTRSPQGDRTSIIERKKFDLASCEKIVQDGFYHITVRHRFLAIDVNDKISASLSNSKLDSLARKEGLAYKFPSDASDPFLRVFSVFDAGQKMEEHLLSPKKPEDLESAFSWLLEMINITSLRLGRDEYVREEKAEKGSADIIACYHESNSSTIIAIDCTMGVPDANKIDKIKNTAEYLSRKIGFPVKAVIVTSENSSITKEQGQKHAVKIIDHVDLAKMMDFYKKGHSYPARQVILEAS